MVNKHKSPKEGDTVNIMFMFVWFDSQSPSKHNFSYTGTIFSVCEHVPIIMAIYRDEQNEN